MNDKKIVQVVCTYPPYKGGTGAVAYNFKKFLKSLYNIDSLLVTPKYVEQKVQNDKDLIYLTPWIQFANAALIPQLYKYIKNADFVIFHMPFFGAVEALLLYLFLNPQQKRKTKILIYYHQDAKINYGFRKYIFAFYNKFIHPLIFKRVDRILVSSFDYAEHSNLQKIYHEYPDKFREIRLGVDTKKFYPIDDFTSLQKIKNKYHLKDGPFITFVGGLGESHYFKGVKILLKALSILKKNDVFFEKALFIGRGNLVEEYKNYAQELAILDKVEFLTNVEDDELNLLYNLSYVNVLPSLDTGGEVFGLVLVEAMASKTPVISSNIVGVRTVNQNNYTGLTFKASDSKDLAQQLEKILKDKNLHDEFAENAYKKVMQEFTWEKTVSNLYSVLKELE